MIASRVAGFGVVKGFDEGSDAAGETRTVTAAAGGARKNAIVHDWLPVYAGAERVLEQMLYIFPEADVFSILDFIPDGERGFLQNKKVKTSFVQKLPWVRKKYRSYLPIMPLAIEQLDVS